MNRIGYNPNSNYNVSFKSNKGVIKAIEALKQDGGPRNIETLQAQIQDVEYTLDFAESIKKLPDEYRKLLLKLSNPAGLLERAQQAGSNIKTAQTIHDNLTKSFAVFKRILG